MYVCPSCSEEIPDRVKKSADECPFCHTPWPPEEEEAPPEEPAAAAKPKGWGDEFRPSAAAPAGAAAAAAEPEKKSKTGLIAVILVLLLGGGGAGYYFGVVRGKGDKGGKGGKKSSSGPSEEEFSAMQSWYNNAQKVILDYMKPDCSVYHEAGYAYYSKLVPVKSFVMRGKKREEQISLKLQLQPGGKGKGPLNVFECPYKVALIHRDHPYVLEAKISKFQRDAFSAALTYADIEVKGKLTGYLKGKDGKPATKFRSPANQTYDGFAFSGLKNAPDPGLQSFAKEQPFKIGAKQFTLGSTTWTKIAPGKYLEGTWQLTMTTKDIKEKFSAWASRCDLEKRKLGKLSSPKEGYSTFEKIHKAGRAVMNDLCSGMEKLSSALEPWKEGDATTAANLLNAARTRWNKEVYDVLQATGKKTGSVVRAKPFN